jgi:hypothetical protein
VTQAGTITLKSDGTITISSDVVEENYGIGEILGGTLKSVLGKTKD